MKCPTCGKDMEPGMIGSECFLGGAKWLGLPHGRRNRQTIGTADWLGYVKISGFRCIDCRQLILNY